jgi:hypothetical protein
VNGFWLNKTIEDWQARIPGIINSFEIQISEINKSKNNASSGRVGNGLVAQNAVALFNSKLNDVTAKKTNWDTTIRNRVLSLQRTGYQTDNAVAQMVADSQVAFFNTYSWLRPEVQTSSFWDELWGSVGEAISNAWQGIKDFFTNSAIFQIIVNGLEIVAGVAVIAIGGIGAILSAGTATPMSIAAIAGGLAMIAHGSGGLQEGIQIYSGDETPSNWLKDMVGETAYNIIGIVGTVVSVIATGGVGALFQLGAGIGVGMASSWIAENAFGCDSTVSQWLGLSASLFAAWGAGKLQIKHFQYKNAIEYNELVNSDIVSKNYGNGQFEHIFKGTEETNASGTVTRVTGGHYECLADKNFRIKPGTIRLVIGNKGAYNARIEALNGRGNKFSTFFPKELSVKQVNSEILSAFDNIKLNNIKALKNDGWYIGTSKRGMQIRIYIKNGVIDTAHPVDLNKMIKGDK